MLRILLPLPRRRVGETFGMFLQPVHSLSASNAMEECEKQLQAAQVPEARLSARYLMAHVLGVKSLSDLLRAENRLLSESELRSYRTMAKKRLKRMPVQYILEEWDFCQLTLQLKPPVLIPRPETEQLVGKVIDDIQMRLKNRGSCRMDGVSDSRTHLRCLDVGCGSGAIALALLDECPQIKMTAIDVDPQAVSLTMQNAERLQLGERLDIHLSDAGSLSFLGESSFDIVVSNPPYISTDHLSDLEPEVALFEDRGALDGGTDGLDVVKTVVQSAACLLKENGSLWLEVDDYHPSLLHRWLKSTDLGMSWVNSHKDFRHKIL